MAGGWCGQCTGKHLRTTPPPHVAPYFGGSRHRLRWRVGWVGWGLRVERFSGSGALTGWRWMRWGDGQGRSACINVRLRTCLSANRSAGTLLPTDLFDLMSVGSAAPASSTAAPPEIVRPSLSARSPADRGEVSPVSVGGDPSASVDAFGDGVRMVSGVSLSGGNTPGFSTRTSPIVSFPATSALHPVFSRFSSPFLLSFLAFALIKNSVLPPKREL